MCGSANNSADRLTAVGILHSLRNSEWVSVAEELAELSAIDFKRVLDAFILYREASNNERQREAPFPARTSLKKPRPR